MSAPPAFATRLAAPDDAALLEQIHAQAFDRPWARSDFDTWLTRNEAITVLAEAEAQAVAFGLVLRAGEDMELLTIATIPAHRRHGAARLVLENLDVEAAKTGAKRWVLEVARNNTSALKLYNGLGFVEIGVRKGYYPQEDDRVDALVLVAPVGSLAGQRVV